MNKLLPVALLVVIVLLIAVGGFVLGPRLLYKIPPFQSWVVSQVSAQSGGTFEFDSIQGDATEAQLQGVWLDLRSANTTNVLTAKLESLTATFNLAALAGLKLDLVNLSATGGEVVVDFRGGTPDHVRLPVNAESFSLSGGRVTIQNVQGYHLTLEEAELDIVATEGGMKGTFSATRGQIGSISLTTPNGSFEMGPEGLTVPSFTARIAGNSKLAINGKMSLSEKGIPLEDITLHVETAALRELLSALGYAEAFDGKADVNANFSGNFRPELKALTGGGTADLSDISAAVNLPSYPLFDNSGILHDLKQITGLNGKATFTFNEDTIVVSSLDLNNPDMKISGDARVGFDKSLKGNQTLLASPTLAQGIPQMAQGVFKTNPDGWTVIPFEFVGQTSSPSVQTDSVITQALTNPVNAVKNVGGVIGGLGGIFGKKKSEEQSSSSENDAPNQEAAPAPAP